MFYVKSELDKGVTLRTEINGEDVFTVCPGCGVEHMVDLAGILSSGDADLHTTKVYCHKCSKKMARQHLGAEWAEQLVREE